MLPFIETSGSSIFLFLFGISVGSFLNVVIDRLPRSESIVKGRSHCDFCMHDLSWYDLIPLVSFIQLEGRCRYCKGRLSFRYSVVECITGFFYVFIYWFTISKGAVTTVFYLTLISGFIAIFFTDLHYRIIPDQLVFTLVVVTCLYFFYSGMSWPAFLNHLGAGASLAVFFLFLAVVTRGRGMGLGDVKYVFIMGLVLGIPESIVAFYLAFLTGAFVSVILILKGKKSQKDTVPFGPFLVTATIIALLYGSDIWILYTKLLGI